MAGNAAMGTTIGWHTSSSGTPAALASVTNISGPSYSAETIDVTAHDSGSNYREMLPSFLSAGEISVDINFQPQAASHKDTAGGVLALFNARTRAFWTIGFPTTVASSVKIPAYVTGFEITSQYDDKLTAAMTLTTDGAATWAYV